ncbi:MAG: hypothetical protein ACM32O_00075 [Clostridia bacterium]
MLQTSQLLQSFVGRASIQSPMPIEFSPGQVFRGTVQKLFPDNLALVQIGGLPVMAKLEASLEAGQKAWLQVQPSAGMVTLKVLTDAQRPQQAQSPTIEGLMNSLGIPESKEAKGIVQALVKGNSPITKDIVSAHEMIAKALGPSPATTEAFLTALGRGLPLTKDVVGAVKAFLSPQTVSTSMQTVMHELDQFLAQLEPQAATSRSALLQQQTGAPVTIAPPNRQAQVPTELRQIATQLKEKLGTVQELMGELIETNDVNPQKGGSQILREPIGQGSIQQPSVPGSAPPPQGRVSNASDGYVQQFNVPENSASTQRDERNTALQPLRQETSTVADRSAQGRLDARPADFADGHIPETAMQEKGNVLKELFRHLGLSHERQLLHQGLSIRSEDAHADTLNNVKALVMQIAQSSSQQVPASLKEAAETLVQQITGQQLMMVQPPNQTLSQLVLQIPLQMANGQESAFIQIESKKKDNGQLDTDNCRVLFNLGMATLGSTMVDVSIVNRIISIQVFNDLPWIEPLLSGGREGLAKELKELGYQLSNLRIQPLPSDQGKMASVSATKHSMQTEYKGMDIRI